jgi:sulfatase modifying factor 1
MNRWKQLRWAWVCIALTSAAVAGDDRLATDPARARIKSARFESILPQAKTGEAVKLAAFQLDHRPVTNAQFLTFVQKHPQWRRDRVARLFADPQYLSHWSGPTTLGGNARASQPVIQVSWFAAKAYCEARSARLPSWYEWEYAAAADEHSPDARRNPDWRQRILDWYARPSSVPLPDVGISPANYYGIHDLHGLVWEWVLDYNALLVSNDSREQGGADRAKFCGEGALSVADRENYAVLMRIAYLSSLEAAYTTGNLGFRCATD